MIDYFNMPKNRSLFNIYFDLHNLFETSHKKCKKKEIKFKRMVRTEGFEPSHPEGTTPSR